MALMSLILMRFVGLFTASTINQALVVLGGYAFVLAGKLGWEWFATLKRCHARTLL